LLTIPFTTNQDYEVVCDDEWVVLPVTTDKRSEFLLCAVEPNHTRAARTSEIIVSCELAEVTVTVTQAAAEGLLSQWADKSFAQRSLAMRFTADWCGYCPLMATAFDSAKEQMPDAFEIVSLHGNESTYEFSGTNQLARRFDIGGYPTGIVDSRASIPNYSTPATTASIAVKVAQETQKSYTSAAGIAVDTYISGIDLTVFVPIYFHQPDSYRVTVLLLEDGIVGYQNGGGNSYTHNDVARYAFTSMSGESVKIESANTVWTQVYTTKINSAWNPDNLKVLVYVERPYGNQAKVTDVDGAEYGDYGDTYIDNCRVAEVGKKAALELR
jgi:thiol-disulfide isomerase/thioredoxin